jgi:hypothetical protein
VALEIKSHGRARTDVLVLQDKEVLGVEVKVSDWKRALAQAVLNRYCFDRSYIALWSTAISDTVIAEAENHGVGVIAVAEDSVRIVSEAPRSYPLSSIREKIVTQAFGGGA